jgi:D-arginine dehydrogenase
MDAPPNPHWLILGAGFAGAATAWALAERGLGPGLVLEQEASYGMHASGRNAALVKVSESDPIIGELSARTLAQIRAFEERPGELLRPTGGLTLAGEHGAPDVRRIHDALARRGLAARLLSRDEATRELPFLGHVSFDIALLVPDEGVADIHALLGRYLERARAGGFRLRTKTRADDLLVENGRVVGVRTATGEEIRAGQVVDATGAWAGRLGRAGRPLGLTPLRRHLFVSGAVEFVAPDLPFVWVEDAEYYFRPEGDGLLLSPCDETPLPPGDPPTDPRAAELLAEKLSLYAPGLADLAIRRTWACLRTFAPDRLPVIGPDPDLPGLFHVSGLGGYGMTCSAAVGELAADLLTQRPVEWIDAGALAPSRLVSAAERTG